MNCCGIDVLRAIAIGFSLGLIACSAPAPESGPTAPVFPIAQEYLAEHPSKIFMEAATYLENGDMDSAAIWFYAGQLRYRALLDCPALKPTPQDLIVFSAQFEIMEPPVNNWAAENLGRFVQILDDVLAWDEQNVDIPAAYSDCSEARAKILSTYQTIRQAALAQ